MKTKKILLELLELLDSFEATVPEADQMGLDAFLSYVLSLRASNNEEVAVAKTAYSDDAVIAQMLSLMYRISRSYMKRALQDSCLQTEEEYTYLVSLLAGGRMTKTELHLRNALERTTGNEMIRRLQRLELIIDMDDPHDKRQKLVQITAKGRAELMSLFPKLKPVTLLLSSGLDDGQRLYLRNILSQMANKHLAMLRELRDAPLSSYIAYPNKE